MKPGGPCGSALNALGGLSRLDPLFLGGAFLGGRRRAVGGLIEAGGL